MKSLRIVTEFNSSAIILAIIHIQNMMLLTYQAWTERRSAVFSFSVEAHSEQQLGGSFCSLLLNMWEEDCGDLVCLEDIHSGVSPFLFITTWYHCYDSLTCSQAVYVIHKSAALSMLSYVALGG